MMSEDDTFTKKRRNLILISLVIFLGQISSIQHGNEINFFGLATASINNSEIMIPAVLWGFLFYFLWHYHSSINETASGKKMAEETKNHTIRLAIENAKHKARKKHPDCTEIKVWNFTPDIKKIKIPLIITDKNTDINLNFVYRGWSLQRLKIKSWLHVTLETSESSEFKFPYLIAGIVYTQQTALFMTHYWS